MARLIDADALLMHIADLEFVSARTGKMTALCWLKFAETLVRNAPTVREEQNNDTDTEDSPIPE